MNNRRNISCAIGVLVALLAACSSSSDPQTADQPVTVETTNATPVSAASETVPTPDVLPTTQPPTVAPTVETTTSSTAPTTEPPPPDGFEPIGDGPYTVGVTTVVIDDPAGQRPLTLDIWFPVESNTAGPLHEYTLLPGNFYRSPRALSAQIDALADGGPFPLVVYSHGSGGVRYVASDYTEVIASHGYVVVAPDHTGNTAADRISGAETEFEVTALNRPNDVRRVIDAMTDSTHPVVGEFAAAVDDDRIAVTGHSFGGFTTLAMASGYTNALGSVEADERVDALIALAPASGDGNGRLLSDENLAAITVPLLVLVGTDDKTTPVEPNVTRIWEHVSSSPLHRADLVAAEHQTFTDVCDYQTFLPTLPDVLPIIVDTIEIFAAEGCASGDMPIERAKALTNTFAIRFLDSVFRDGKAITAESTVIPTDVLFSSR